MKNPIRTISALCFISLLFLTACHKDEKVEVDNETQSAIDNAVADQEFMAVVPATQSHAINTKGTGAQQRELAFCDSLTKISGDTLWGAANHVNPTYTMSISNKDCSRTMADGKSRTGYLEVKLTGKIKNAGSKMLIKFVNYKSAGISYSCDSLVLTTVVSNTTLSKFNIKLYKGVCQNTNSWTINYYLDRTVSFYPQGNPIGTIPVTYIYGTSGGKNRKGRNFVVNIPEATALVKHNSCEFISGGIMTLTPEGFETRTIDYGYSVSPNPANGCDEDASFNVNGNTIAFKLK
jgi:hypothetical protein